MENDDGKINALGLSKDDVEARCAVNSLILDYYKKFGKKRDLEQFFSLSTAQSDIRDTSGLFWRKMKSENDSSDGEQKSNSAAHELCRISIRCSVPDPSSSQSDDTKTKTESPNTSPPIIEDPLGDIKQADDEWLQSDDNHSQKSFDPLLDLSAHKPLSPTSSITSQRKLEWDSLADVGYAYESERKTSGSTLSTLERLALRQQYTNNDSKQDIGSPTCHSTPLDENESKSKTKKSTGRVTKITKKDFDFVEFNLPHTSDTKPHQSIHVNLTKHISFHVDKDAEVTVDNIQRDVNISPEKLSDETAKTFNLPMDKENQTSLLKTNDKSVGSSEVNKPVDLKSQKIPVMISLNTLRKKIRRKKSIASRRKLKTKRKIHENKGKPSQEKSGSQLSEAESFEYMPGHIYNQNQLKKAGNVNESKPSNNTTTGNKSSLESSAGRTTDSSNGSKHSFTKDLEKCIEVLKFTLQKRYDDSELKKKLVKEIIQRLINSKYRDDDTSTDFLSGLSFSSKNNDLKCSTTTSTSDANNTDCSKRERPRKSILRMEKFDSKPLASTSQSVPNLATAVDPENINTNLKKKFAYNSTSDDSNRWKITSENDIPKTSSEELYLKYLEALKREESYKRQLKNKEMFLKQKLASSETAIKASMNQKSQMNNRLKQLMKDLTGSNCDDGSGDASKLESGSISYRNMKTSHAAKSQRSHSVFTLSSSFTEPHEKQNIKKKHFDQDFEPSTSRNHYCCCPHHGVTSRVGYCDSSVQVNIQYQCEEEKSEKPIQDLKTHCQKCNRDITHVQPEIVNNIIPNQSDKCQSYANPSKTEGTSTNYPNCRHQSKHITCSDVEIYNQTKTHRKIADKTTNELNNDKDIYECVVCKCCKVPKHGIEDSSNVINANILGLGSSKVSSGVDRIQFIRAPCNLDNMSTSTNSNHYSQRHCKSSQTNLLPRMTSLRKNENSSDPANSYGSSIQCALGSEVGKQKIIIHEATRCIQTEISIDPKISDPSLADIIIINNCAELIELKSREIIMNTFDEIKTFTDVYTSSESGKLPLKSEDGFFQHEIKESDLNIIESKDSNKGLTKTMPKDYTIPIKGTNMTLMVSLATSDSKQSNQKVDQQVGTVKAPMKEDGTSISLECAKSIQYDYTPMNIAKNDKAFADYNLSKNSEVDKTSPRKSNPSPTRSSQRNTYPKIVKMKENKPLRRANTDTGKLKTCCVQTESSYEMMPLAAKKTESKVTAGTLKKNQDTEINMDTKITSNDINNENFLRDTKEIGIQKYLSDEENKEFKSVGTDIAILDQGLEFGCQTDFCEQYEENIQQKKAYVSEDNIIRDETSKPHESRQKQCAACSLDVCQCGIDHKSILKKNSGNRSEIDVESNVFKDPIMTVIQDITRRYSKSDVTKLKKKKCFNEIVSVLNYLLETEGISDQEPKSAVSITPESSDNSKKSLSVKTRHQSDDNKKMTHSESAVQCDKAKKKVLRTSESESLPSKRDKSVQQSSKSTSKCTESSDLPCSTDRPSTSDSTACKIFNKIKKECEKYHMRRKCGRKCEISSSTSVNCDDCKKVHHCSCRHKCKRSKIVDKLQKKCVAYNLILQTSESMLSEETVCDNSRPLPNVVVKVPKRKDKYRTETCKETIFRIEKGLKDNSSPRVQRSKSCHKDSEVSSNDDFIRRTHCTVREYLEKNRPDFVEKSGERQNCLKFINEIRANERAAHRNLLSLQVDKEPDLTTLTSEQLRDLATQIGLDIRRKKPAPKFISEREMKKHSEKIYKTLPEVVQKKEDKKKENIKKTNLLMANIFKKNLQKKTLRGSVNLSNYSTVIKI